MSTASQTATSPVAIKIDVQMKKRVQRLAQARNRTPHWLMREAITQYVDREEKREALRQDAICAWNDYEASGMHVTAAEADAWLAKLEAGKNVKPPKAHA